MDRDSGFVGRLDVVETGRRRRWGIAEKIRIVEESLAGDRQASRTARRYGISNSLLFKWRKAYREGRLGGALPAGFVPAVIVAGGSPPDGAKSPGGRMEVVGVSGRRIIIGPDFDASAVVRLLTVLEDR